MSLLERAQQWFRRRRRKLAAKGKKAELREFVYLDEVSVYSLIASRLGPVAAEFTATEKKSLQDELSGSVGGGAVGIVKGESSTRALEVQTIGSQVVRKSIVQTTFKELYDFEEDTLAIRPGTQETPPVCAHDVSTLESTIDKLVDSVWVIDPNTLTRGRLFEAEVELAADAIFRVSAVMSAILGITRDIRPEMFGLRDFSAFDQVESVNRILEKLFVGLVPIRGRLIDYNVIRIRGKDWLVHRKACKSLGDEATTSQHAYVVCVAEQALFWKDVRRVLFSGSRFRVLCRIAQDGLQDSWTPIKLVHVLNEVNPTLGRTLENASRSALAAMGSADQSAEADDTRMEYMKEALIGYAQMLARHYGCTIGDECMQELQLLAADQCQTTDDIRARRRAFGLISDTLEQRFQIERSPMVEAQYRQTALLEMGLSLNGQLPPAAISNVPDTSSSKSSSERFLDSELVAIYW